VDGKERREAEGIENRQIDQINLDRRKKEGTGGREKEKWREKKFRMDTVREGRKTEERLHYPTIELYNNTSNTFGKIFTHLHMRCSCFLSRGDVTLYFKRLMKV